MGERFTESPDCPDAPLPRAVVFLRVSLPRQMPLSLARIPFRLNHRFVQLHQHRIRRRTAPRPAAASSCRSRAGPFSHQHPPPGRPSDDEKTRSSVSFLAIGSSVEQTASLHPVRRSLAPAPVSSVRRQSPTECLSAQRSSPLQFSTPCRLSPSRCLSPRPALLRSR